MSIIFKKAIIVLVAITMISCLVTACKPGITGTVSSDDGSSAESASENTSEVSQNPSEDGSTAASSDEISASGSDVSDDGLSTVSSVGSGTSSTSSSTAVTPIVTPLPASIDMKGKTVKININGFDAANIMKTQAGQYFMKHVDAISKKFNCKIVIGAIDWTTFYTKMAAGDPGADILGIGGNLNFANSMKNKWLYPISSLGMDLTQAQFDKEAQKVVYVENQYYAAIPSTAGWENVMDTMAMFFNKRLVQDAGYNPDSLYTMQKNGTWNWAKFEEIGKKINKDTNSDGKTDIFGVVNGYWDNFLWSALIISNGSDWVKRVNGNMSFTGDDSKAVTALNFWQKIAYTNQMVYLSNDATADAMFIQGKAGFLPQYVNRANFPAFKTMKDDWGIVFMPKGPDATRYYSAVSWFDGFTIPAVALQNDDAGKTYGRQLATIINELCKPSIPANLINSITEIQFESLVRDEGTIETLNLIKSNKIRSEYYNGISSVGQSLNNELITQVAKGNKDVTAVISQNKTAYSNTLKDLWSLEQ
ncbi:MAG: ABC transporter substrate-binding protein [Saccharofermentanales bacterium]